VKQIHHEELKDSDNERPCAFPKIMLKQTYTGVQQLHGDGKRTQDQQRRLRGRRIPTIEKPLATTTLIAVTTKASWIAFIVVIDSSL
jgi:hypothetical protein